MFCYESVIGVSAHMGTNRSLNRVYTQIGGIWLQSLGALVQSWHVVLVALTSHRC
jgi:hypothetical protein